ncbi:ATP-binding cassette domain-containing protein, partial [Streptococcus pneumoniae]|nr:ATP-binding cassette domain-containing protein [Streptococcus pneumoniae]
EGGQNFSGGEKQRLAIARALLSKADLYIFDEATSNLDSFSEQIIQDLIFNKIMDKTTIVVAHRLSTILRCDKICFLENGTIV